MVKRFCYSLANRTQRLLCWTVIWSAGMVRNVEGDGFYFRSLEIVRLCPARKRLHFRNRKRAAATLMSPGNRGESGIVSLSFIHYAVCVTQCGV